VVVVFPPPLQWSFRHPVRPDGVFATNACFNGCGGLTDSSLNSGRVQDLLLAACLRAILGV